MKKNLIDKVKEKWKVYSVYISIALVFLMIGMTLTEVETIKQILVNTISGLITQLPWLIIGYLGFKTIGKAINDLGKKIPEFILAYEKTKLRAIRIEKAAGLR